MDRMYIFSEEVLEQFGYKRTSKTSLYRGISSGVIPAPDGQLPNGRLVWYPSNIEKALRRALRRYTPVSGMRADQGKAQGEATPESEAEA